jgi:hypothetical protein
MGCAPAVAYVAAPGPLRAFALRVRARRGPNVAAVALARKLCVLAWHLLSRQEDYAFARPSLVQSKLRRTPGALGTPAMDVASSRVAGLARQRSSAIREAVAETFSAFGRLDGSVRSACAAASIPQILARPAEAFPRSRLTAVRRPGASAHRAAHHRAGPRRSTPLAGAGRRIDGALWAVVVEASMSPSDAIGQAPGGHGRLAWAAPDSRPRGPAAKTVVAGSSAAGASRRPPAGREAPVGFCARF